MRLTSRGAGEHARSRAAGASSIPGATGAARATACASRSSGPSWLVLGESYDAGWRARCDGRSLGRPVALQGYANGWPVQRGCRDVSFAFAPNRALLAGDAISLVACLALLALLVLRRPRGAGASLAPLPDAPRGAWPLRRALAAGVAAGLVLGFVFALRAGAVLGPLTFLVLWRGGLGRTLALARRRDAARRPAGPAPWRSGCPTWAMTPTTRSSASPSTGWPSGAVCALGRRAVADAQPGVARDDEVPGS